MSGFVDKGPFVDGAFLAFLVGVMAFCACPNPQPPHQNAADGATLGTPQTFCDSLARNGCRAGLDPKCADVVAHVVDAGLTRIDLTCVANAQSKDAIQKCGASCD